MIEEIASGLFRLEIPIPKSPLKATNAYVIKGEERDLLIDTGVNQPQSLEVMRSCLVELAVDMEKTDIFLTHLHADHSGLIPSLKTASTQIFASAVDAKVVNGFMTSNSHWTRLHAAACRNGFTEMEASQAMSRHPGSSTAIGEPLQFTYVAEGTQISIGFYHLDCIATPGHTKGHLCLYDAERRILLSGDHILGDISPNITCWDNSNPLQDFLSSLQKASELSVDLVLPGHRRVFSDCRGRIDALLKHHRKRAEEVYAILADGSMTGYQVAARMTWDMVYNSWDDVAVPQKFFATGEALSHLRYLECQGLLKQNEQGDKAYFSRC